MGKKTPAQPAAPDPAATARAQGAANKETAIAQGQLNMINQETPYGSLQFTQRGTTAEGIPQYTATQTLSPEQQVISDLAEQAATGYGQTANTLLGNTSTMLGQPFSLASLGAAPTVNEARRTAARDALMQRLQPDLDRDLSALQTSLANQGIGIGSEAYNAELDRYTRGVNDARLAADLQATGLMGTEYGLESSARNAAINELLMPRQTALNELAALVGGTQVSQPSFINPPQTSIAPTDVLGAQALSSNVQMNNYNQAMGRQNAAMGGLYGLGGAAISSAPFWSDRRLKRNIEKVGRLANGLAVYTFDYIWGGARQIGLMAQEVAKVRPEAVINIGGYLAVDYAKAMR